MFDPRSGSYQLIGGNTVISLRCSAFSITHDDHTMLKLHVKSRTATSGSDSFVSGSGFAAQMTDSWVVGLPMSADARAVFILSN